MQLVLSYAETVREDLPTAILVSPLAGIPSQHHLLTSPHRRIVATSD
jgi:hypothetical protein